MQTHAKAISRSLKKCSSSYKRCDRSRHEHSMQKVLVRDRSASAMAMDLSCTGTSRSGRVVRERRVRHEPASGRRRCRPAPTCLAAAKAGQVGICGGCIGWDNCSIRRDASMPSVEVSAARSASFVLGVLQCRIGTHRARAGGGGAPRHTESGTAVRRAAVQLAVEVTVSKRNEPTPFLCRPALVASWSNRSPPFA